MKWPIIATEMSRQTTNRGPSPAQTTTYEIIRVPYHGYAACIWFYSTMIYGVYLNTMISTKEPMR